MIFPEFHCFVMRDIAQQPKKLACFTTHFAEHSKVVVESFMIQSFFLFQPLFLAPQVEVLILPIINIGNNIADFFKLGCCWN